MTSHTCQSEQNPECMCDMSCHGNGRRGRREWQLEAVGRSGGQEEEEGIGKEKGCWGIWARLKSEVNVGQSGCEEQGTGQPATVEKPLKSSSSLPSQCAQGPAGAAKQQLL